MPVIGDLRFLFLVKDFFINFFLTNFSHIGMMSSSKHESDSDDDVPTLSVSTLAALQEFLSSKNVEELKLDDDTRGNVCKEQLFDNDLTTSFPEDWQMSQFWYDQETSNFLAEEVLRLVDGHENEGKVACLSCPSIFRACKGSAKVDLFEYDRRFEAFGSAYYFYDYNEPEKIPDSCRSSYSVVIADPPFLAEECLSKVTTTIKLLMREDAKIILCTGDVMTEHAEKLLNLKKTEFTPRHKNNLGNQFACFANYHIQIPKNL